MFIVETRRRFLNVSKTFLLAMLVFYFAYHMISGEKGVLAMIKLQQKVVAARENLAEAEGERTQLEHRVNRLSPHALDTDLLDEQVRKQLGQIGQGEIVYIPSVAPMKNRKPK